MKNNDDNAFGEHSWTFRHPDFHADRPECLENIKRKVPTQRKSTAASAAAAAAATPRSTSPLPTPTHSHHAHHSQSGSDEHLARAVEALQAQVEALRGEQERGTQRLQQMQARYENTIAELVEWQRSMAQTDGIMRNLIQYFLQLENGEQSRAALAVAVGLAPPVPPLAPFLTPPYSC